MDPRLLRILARERERDLRAAVTRPRLSPPRPAPSHEAVTIRYAFPDDARAVARLATLDSSAVPAAPILVADVEGELRAALSLVDGTVIANPFHRSVQLVELLRARGRQLTATGGGRRPSRLPLRGRVLGVRRSY
jgi:hypothetical protein